MARRDFIQEKKESKQPASRRTPGASREEAGDEQGAVSPSQRHRYGRDVEEDPLSIAISRRHLSTSVTLARSDYPKFD